MTKMLDLITLQVVEDIFSPTINIPSLAKSLYINCLIKHFRGKEATEENCRQFMFETKDIPNYNKFYPTFLELHNANLVSINHGQVIFQNKWGHLIDRSKMLSNELGKAKDHSILDYAEQLKQNTSMIDVVGMKNKLSRNQVLKMVDIFLLEQDATQTSYKDLGELSKHFIYWVNLNMGKIQMENEVIKSKGKILGLE
jgi:hypothetical protein